MVCCPHGTAHLKLEPIPAEVAPGLGRPDRVKESGT